MMLVFGAFCVGFRNFPNTRRLWIETTILWPIAVIKGMIYTAKVIAELIQREK